MALDPVLVAVCKAVYGDVVDPIDFAKSVDAADVHIEEPIGDERRKRRRKLVAKAMPAQPTAQQGQVQPNTQPPGKKKLLAAGLLAGAAIEATAAKDTIPDLITGIKDVKPAVSDASGVKGKLKALKPLAIGPPNKPLIPNRPISPVGAGPGTKAAAQVGNFAVGLGAARTLLPKKNQQGVGKALRLRLKPLGDDLGRKVVSPKARRPAGSPPVAKSFVATGEISKVDEDQHLVFGWLNVSEWNGQPVVDRQGDIVPIEELEKAAYDYVLDCRLGGDQHQRNGLHKDLSWNFGPKQTGMMVESMVFTPEKIAAMGLPSDFPQAWWGGYKVDDEDSWQKIKNKERTGFSVHGTGSREPVAKGARTEDLKRRTNAALHPPKVRLKPVDSSAIAAMGYQPQTHRMAYAMRSRPGAPYEYRMKPRQAHEAQGASSLGHYYATQVRGKTKRATRYTLADRARLFADPPKRDVAKSTAPVRRERARKVELAGQLTAGTVGSGFGAAKLRDAFKEDYPERFEHGVKRLHALTEHPKVSEGNAARIARTARAVESGKPGFKPLVAAVTAGGVATAAHRYQQLSGLREKRRQSIPGLSGVSIAKLSPPTDADQALSDISMGTQKLGQLAMLPPSTNLTAAAANAAQNAAGKTGNLTAPVATKKKALKLIKTPSTGGTT